VSDVAPARVARKIALDRTTHGWRSLLTLARLLLGRDWQDTRSARDAPEGISLLFPMNELFEAYVAALARRALSPLGVEVKAQCGGAFCLTEWVDDDGGASGRLFATKPDIMLRRSGRTLAIVDTKWKAIGRDIADRKRGVNQADIYQMMAYAQLYRADRLMLLYPHHESLGGSSFGAEYRIAVPGGSRLDIATIDVRTTREACAAALANLLLPLTISDHSVPPSDGSLAIQI
jgi:5-methylcytosine-specific restriction enzyme subunit McrC